jgi:hypothetical protein
MKSEEIILMVFVGFVVVGVPILLWFIDRDNKRREEEEKKLKRK